MYLASTRQSTRGSTYNCVDWLRPPNKNRVPTQSLTPICLPAAAAAAAVVAVVAEAAVPPNGTVSAASRQTAQPKNPRATPSCSAARSLCLVRRQFLNNLSAPSLLPSRRPRLPPLTPSLWPAASFLPGWCSFPLSLLLLSSLSYFFFFFLSSSLLFSSLLSPASPHRPPPRQWTCRRDRR